LDVALFGHHGTDPVATFLSGLWGKHDLSDATFLADQFGYRTAITRLGLNGRSTTPTETSSKNDLTHSQCGSTVSIIHGWEVGRAFACDLRYLCITTTGSDHTNRSMIERQLTTS